MKKLFEIVKNRPYLAGFLIALLVLACFFPVAVKEGTVTRCFYGEVLKEEVSEQFVPWWARSQYKVATKWVLCSRHQKAEKLYSTWSKLKKEGKAAEAETIKKKIEALVGPDWSPELRKAGTGNGGSTSTGSNLNNTTGGGSTGGNQNNSGGGSPDGGSNDSQNNDNSGGENQGSYSGDLLSLLPSDLSGYEFYLREEYPLQALVLARPLKDKNVVNVIFSVERVDNQTAQTYLTSFKESYGRDRQEVKVGSVKGYWGTTLDKTKAVLIWRRLDLFYTIELTVKTDAVSYRSTMINWANSLF